MALIRSKEPDVGYLGAQRRGLLGEREPSRRSSSPAANAADRVSSNIAPFDR